jgi:hypothetical protein
MRPTAPGPPDGVELWPPEDQKRMANGVQLSPEDQQRMTKLREEAVARMTEMGLIVSRALNQEPKLVTSMNIKSEQRGEWVLVLLDLSGPGPGAGCHYDPPGVCAVC